jgi:hypothetical protein
MRLWYLRIDRFRGIRYLEWAVRDRVTCLVGAGDQGKTTILDAIGALGSTRTRPFTETDFHGATLHDGPIEIEAVVGELPQALLADNRFGLDLIGVDDQGNLHPEPGPHQPAVRLRLDVDASLEPVWRIVSSRNPDGRPVTARDRAALRLARVGMDPDRQFHLGRSSALLGLVSDPSDVSVIVETAYEAARNAVRDTDMTALAPTIIAAGKIGVHVGAGQAVEKLSVGLELSRTTGAGLSLQGDGIPLRAAGLGTRRLLAVGLELGSTKSGPLVCLDELEHGLEPHRIIHLVRTLRRLVVPKNDGEPGAHVLFTTHSPVVLAELGSVGVSVVRTGSEETVVSAVPPKMVTVVRSAPEALLSRRVVVAEGKTEVGIVRAFDSAWRSAHDDQTLAHRGVAVVDGGGTSAGERAQMLAALGYPTLLFVDSDAPVKPPVADLTAAGVTVLQWAGGVCTEERALTDLSWGGVLRAFEALVDLGYEPGDLFAAIVGGPQQVKLLAKLRLTRADLGDSLDSMVEGGVPEAEARAAFAAGAKRKSWFKRIDPGEALGAIAATDPGIPVTPFGELISRLENWCHG